MKGREHIHVIDGTSVSSHIDNIIDLPRLLVVSHGSSTVFPPHAHFLASSLHTRANGKNTVTQSLPSQLMSGAEQNRTPIQLLASGSLRCCTVHHHDGFARRHRVCGGTYCQWDQAVLWLRP